MIWFARSGKINNKIGIAKADCKLPKMKTSNQKENVERRLNIGNKLYIHNLFHSIIIISFIDFYYIPWIPQKSFSDLSSAKFNIFKTRFSNIPQKYLEREDEMTRYAIKTQALYYSFWIFYTKTFIINKTQDFKIHKNEGKMKFTFSSFHNF